MRCDARPPACDARRSAWLLLALSLLLTPVIHATTAERGLPLIAVFPPEVHKAGPQSFDVTQDPSGILYFGNLHGLLTYDGAWWRLRKLPDDQAVLSLASDETGRIALGLVNDLGYLDAARSGQQEFHSLASQLPQAQREVGDIRGVCSTSAGFLFVAEQSLIVWNGGAPRVVATFAAEKAPWGCAGRGDDIYLRSREGLLRFDPRTLQITHTPVEGRISVVLRLPDGAVITAVRDKGLFELKGTTVTPFAPEFSEWMKKKQIVSACRLRDGHLIFVTRQHGAAVLDRSGEIQQLIGPEAGIPDALVNEAFVDREGSLWLAMEGPIVRIDVASAVTVIDSRRGLRGAAGDIARLGDHVYASTTHGLYVINADGAAQRVEAIADSAWRLLNVDDALLVASAHGVYRIDERGSVTHIIDRLGEINDMSQSTSDPSRVWLAEGDGIASIRRKGTAWEYESPIPGVPHNISSVLERDGVLWAGSVFDGVLRIADARGTHPSIARFGTGETNVFTIGGRIVFVRATGEVLHVDGRGRLGPDPLLGHINAPRGFFVIGEDPRGNVWINSTPPRLFERETNGSYSREGKPLVAVTATDIQNLRITPDGIIWFASDKGLFRYEPGATSAAVAAQPAPLVRRVVAGADRVVFNGVAKRTEPVELRDDFGRIRIEVAPVSYRPGISYQYRLDPIDTDWSNWVDEPFIDYTTLDANHYTFRVRARGPAMIAGGEARWSFTVLPPWYRTPWAYALWALLVVAAVVAVTRIRTGTLRRQAERLRAKVEEKTGELQETVKLLESANLQLETLSLEDDLTGIANRRSFDRALADEWNRARRHSQPIALILLDLDHFKELNDRRGHPAGDACLRRIGAFLADAVRRSGEVVARYGGEEFAILLPGVDDDIALRVAETLRDGIERLAIPSGSGQFMTGSCGVAAVIPRAELTADSLVASCDRALYAAKHSGRNCVRVADETITGTWLREVTS